MIDNRLEYQRMYDVERKLWWYKILHEKVLFQIEKHFGTKNKNIKILDAASGTGGLLSFLKEQGFTNISGFDYSSHAVDFSLERQLDVGLGDLRQAERFRPQETYDLICCNDAFYFLTDQEISHTLSVFKQRLKPGGIVLINIHAFEAFSGTHDLAVGSTRRFVLSDFLKYTRQAGLSVTFSTYWPFALSIPIWFVRQIQKYQIRKGNVNISEVDSDVKYPGDLVNNLLYTVMKIERTVLRKAPFGSSLFMLIK
ncbi:MAG TPA: class I SAM-dependent methyltransferase [Dyadobacter sp.]|jgi:SAM-dependent methyltransferase|nr:class I SAM-dependent methyltransferase [Dyadobacter sp.]